MRNGRPSLNSRDSHSYRFTAITISCPLSFCGCKSLIPRLVRHWNSSRVVGPTLHPTTMRYSPLHRDLRVRARLFWSRPRLGHSCSLQLSDYFGCLGCVLPPSWLISAKERDADQQVDRAAPVLREPTNSLVSDISATMINCAGYTGLCEGNTDTSGQVCMRSEQESGACCCSSAFRNLAEKYPLTVLPIHVIRGESRKTHQVSIADYTYLPLRAEPTLCISRAIGNGRYLSPDSGCVYFDVMSRSGQPSFAEATNFSRTTQHSQGNTGGALIRFCIVGFTNWTRSFHNWRWKSIQLWVRYVLRPALLKVSGGAQIRV